MRTKTLLVAAAAIAAGLASSMAQAVYSQNVVGYVNKPFQSGFFVMASNPLNNGTNGLKQLIPTPPDGTSIFRWNVGLQDLDAAVPTYFTGSGTWIPEAQIPPGEGFFVVGGANFTNTFVGEVLQGALSIGIAGGGNFQAIGSKVPQAGNLGTVLTGYVPTDGDSVFTWDVPTQDLGGAVPTYFTSTGTWIPDTTIGVGDAFFLVRVGGPTTWTRNFTVN